MVLLTVVTLVGSTGLLSDASTGYTPTNTINLTNWTAYLYNDIESRMTPVNLNGTTEFSSSVADLYRQNASLAIANFVNTWKYFNIVVVDNSCGITSPGKWCLNYVNGAWTWITLDSWKTQCDTTWNTANESSNVITTVSPYRGVNAIPSYDTQSLLVSKYDIPAVGMKVNLNLTYADFLAGGSSLAVGVVNSGVSTLPGADNAAANLSAVADGANDFVVVLSNTTAVDTRLNHVSIYYGGNLLSETDISPVRTKSNSDAFKDRT